MRGVVDRARGAASSSRPTRFNTPNPSKAPWYFLGLQEMLVYFDPWLAGVVLPGSDHRRTDGDSVYRHQPQGNGYYTFNERKAEITHLPVRFRDPLVRR